MRMIFRLCVVTLGVVLLPALLGVTVLIRCALDMPVTAGPPTEEELSAYAATNARLRTLSATNSTTQLAQGSKCD